MKYALEDLLRVRKFRETSASNEVIAKKCLLEDAANLVKQKEQELSDYIAWRIKTEDALYEAVKNQLVSVKGLDDLKQKILMMREKEMALEKAVSDAENARQAAKDELDKARDAYHAAVREKRKIEEHRDIWLEEMLKEEEQAQDKEMEDFQKMKIDDDEVEDEDF